MIYFSFREREILRLLACGRSAAEIGEALETSVATINRHLREIQQKAGLENRHQILPYLHQNPQCLVKRNGSSRGLHAPSETCRCFNCRTLRGESLAA